MKTHMKSAVTWDDTERTLCGMKVKDNFIIVENDIDPHTISKVTCKRCLKILNEV